MKKLLVLAITFCIAQMGLRAQSPQPKTAAPQTQNTEQQKAKKESMDKQIGLTKDQSQKISAYKKEEKSEKAEILNNKNLSQKQKDDALKALKKEYKEKIDGVLTPDQKAKEAELKKNPSPKN